jgi:integrase
MADIRVTMRDGREKRVRKKKIPTKEMALLYESKVKTAAFEGRYFETGSNLTVEQVWKIYEPITRRDNDSWRDDVGRAKHLTRLLGKRKVEQLALTHVEQYRSRRMDEVSNRTKRVPAIGTINREVGLLKRMINYAVRRGDLRMNPIALVRALHESNIRQVVISERRFEVLLEKADPPLRPIILLAYDCGMRKMEILMLRWSQLNLHTGVAYLAPWDTKTDESREIYLTDRAIRELQALKGIDDGLLSINGYAIINPQTGEPWVDIKKMFKRACEAAGLVYGRDNGVIFHDLRRSFVTNARKRGIPESVVMAMSGHRTRNVFDRYNIVDNADLKNAVRRMERARREELREQKRRRPEV